MKIPTSDPSTLKTRLTAMGRRPKLPLLRSHASSAEMPTKKPKSNRPQTPTDIGDQYLKLRPASPGVVFTIMCKSLIPLAILSDVSTNGQDRGSCVPTWHSTLSGD